MKKYKTGLVGCGRIGSLLEEDPLRGKPCTHAGGFSTLPAIDLVAGCDISPERLHKFGQRWNVNQLYSDYREMLKKERLDILCIATWTALHADMTLTAAKAGVKGIFCEKPIAIDLVQARKMVRVCQKQNIPLIINHERRWDANYQQARKLIGSGKIGEIKTIIGNTLSWKPGKLQVSEHGGGPLFHDGTHLTDLLLFFGGSVEWVSGQETRPGGKKYIEETASAMLGFKSGAIGFIEGGGARKYFNFELDIQGTEGRLLIGNSGRELFVTKKSRRFTGFQELEKIPFPEPKKYESPFIGGAREIIKSIRTGKPGISTGVDGYQALEIIAAVYKSAQQKGKRVMIG
ncbi:MAG: Gfo/Idh/MocA family oxidoreductase [Nitrospinaceae bacterium]|nr:Gfo/Idh/MocA family oxidoreductase [Nitrospina sp.]MBT5375178.1 Gfo/Idh/MocA family oxidoreductase [Nitrospinaceae bacterium]MBT5869881.1 Gfo/Idh/MocA family oxidoreductase [Nitrospinaceae bacterium]